MIGERKGKPAIEIGLNLGDALERIGLSDIADSVLNLIQQGKLEVTVELGKKHKGKVPPSLTIRLKKSDT